MAADDACPGFPTDISAAFNVPTSFKILTCSRLLWGPCSVASTLRFFMHELSGCCDSHSNYLHQCLLSTALTCHVASACFLSYRVINVTKIICKSQKCHIHVVGSRMVIITRVLKSPSVPESIQGTTMSLKWPLEMSWKWLKCQKHHIYVVVSRIAIITRVLKSL